MLTGAALTPRVLLATVRGFRFSRELACLSARDTFLLRYAVGTQGDRLRGTERTKRSLNGAIAS